MATPGQLVERMADVLGVPAPTVSQYDRQLAEAGLRTSGGRGTSAAKVTAADAANLLIAILGSPISGASISSARQICETVGALPARKYSDIKKIGRYGFRSLGSLPKAHIFRDAVAILIEGVSRGEPYEENGGTPSGLRYGHLLSLRVAGPVLSGGIAFHRGTTTRDMAALYYGPEDIKESTQSKSDLVQDRRVSFRTIQYLASLMMVDGGSHGQR